jgi:homoserine O-succinyltransferase/O-acetyltransferase
MNHAETKTVKVAILDLYEGAANQGMRCIREIINQYGEATTVDLTWDEFDVRQKLEVPDLSYDIYISSGGPGSPLESVGTEWENNYFNWIQQIEEYNNKHYNIVKKKVFFICHSFQMACRYFDAGNVCKRKSTAFGIFPVHLMNNAQNEPVLEGLNNPFYVVDSRDYQVIEPNHAKLAAMGATILAIEKDRPHVPLERAVMAIRFNENMIGTQFHPEADAVGMKMYFETEEKKKTVVENYGLEKWQSMIDHLNDPDKIVWTYSHILPNFLKLSIDSLELVTA